MYRLIIIKPYKLYRNYKLIIPYYIIIICIKKRVRAKIPALIFKYKLNYVSAFCFLFFFAAAALAGENLINRNKLNSAKVKHYENNEGHDFDD